jgi:aspartyl-tRNA(Asn)/glutamyl-tRNA(Gln) amidotransferase subunit A
VAGWVGLQPTPARLSRLAWAIGFLTEATQVIADVPGIEDDEVPEPQPNEIPLRYQRVRVEPTTATQPYELGMAEAALAIRRGELSPVELLESCLATIERTEPAVGAFVATTESAARTQARLANQGPPTGLLHGIPFAAQDLIDTVNVQTQFGGAACTGRMPRWDATVITRIRAAGGILVGKTATGEIGYGASHVRNPWDPTESAGGSAAALAARQIPIAVGTDTGVLAARCGTTAIRPTFGLVSRSGAMVLAPSFDTVGPMARGARDCLLLLQVMTRQAPPEPVSAVVDSRQVRIGVADGCPPEQLAVAEILRAAGAQIVSVALPSWEITRATACVLGIAEAAAQFRTYLAGGDSFAEDVQAFLEAGLTVPVADFLHAHRVRAAIRREYAELFGRVDLILSPSDQPDGTPLLGRFTLPAGLTGLPTIAFPCGFTTSGMPDGAQLMGPARTEPLLAAIAEVYQRETDWHTRTPLPALS